MEIWLILALMAAGAAFVLFAGVRFSATGTLATGPAAQVAVYKDQLEQIESDVARGLIAKDEAETHRTEVARRLLAAAKEEGTAKPTGQSHFGLVAALLVPIAALAIYYSVGAPAARDLPQTARLAEAEKNGDVAALIYQVERHLADKPDDATGWEVLLPNYLTLGRYNDAAVAYRRLIDLKGATADLHAGLAEALAMGNQGLMTAESQNAAAAALALDPKNVQARFYQALGFGQDGRTDEALRGFEALRSDSPADAPWLPAVDNEIAQLKAKEKSTRPPALTQEQIKDVQSLSPEDQQQMIRGMVEGLAAKLAENPNDLEGWLRLIRARTVLNEHDVAKTSLDKARKTFEKDSQAVAQLEALAEELKLQ